MEYSNIHNAIETIYANILRQNLKQFAICSTEPQAGNTTLALAIAARAAKAGRRVLLIEFNTLSPVLAKQLQLPSQEWLPLTGNWEHAAQESNIPGLFALCCPDKSSHCIEFRDQETLQLFFDSALQRFELIICDCSPLLTTKTNLSDNHFALPIDIICSASHATLLNIMTGKTTESDVDEAKDILHQSGALLAGAVMNDQYAPGLQQELIRETYRFERLMPKCMASLRLKFRKMMLLNQEL